MGFSRANHMSISGHGINLAIFGDQGSRTTAIFPHHSDSNRLCQLLQLGIRKLSSQMSSSGLGDRERGVTPRQQQQTDRSNQNYSSVLHPTILPLSRYPAGGLSRSLALPGNALLEALPPFITSTPAQYLRDLYQKLYHK